MIFISKYGAVSEMISSRYAHSYWSLGPGVYPRVPAKLLYTDCTSMGQQVQQVK